MSIIGKIFITLFLGIFIVSGVFVVVSQFTPAEAVDTEVAWTPMPVIIDAVEVRAKDFSFVPEVRYRYEVGGRQYTGTAVGPMAAWSDAGDCQRWADTRTQGWYDPADPARAVLRLDSGMGDWFLVLIFGTMFSGIPLVIVIGIWSSGGKNKKQSRASTDNRKAGTGIGCLFILIGIGGAGGMMGLPLYRMLKVSLLWEQVPAQLLNAGVESHSGDDGTTYSVWVHYRHQRDEYWYHGSTYGHLGGSSSGSSSKREAVKGLQERNRDEQFEVWVNPSDPYQSVVSNAFPGHAWWGLFFVVFGGFGVLALVASRKGRQRQKASGTAAFRSTTMPTAGAAEATVLKSGSSPIGRLIGMLFFAVFWNGISWTIMFMFMKDGWVWLPGIFIGLFCLIGAAIVLLGLPYAVLACFNPRITLELPQATLRLGDTVDLTWSFDRDPHRITVFTVELIAEERATYRRGTTTVTDTNCFHFEVLQQSDGGPEWHGRLTLPIPAEAMHSFKADNNEIRWLVHVHGDIARWPDVDEQFTITVLPQQPGAAA